MSLQIKTAGAQRKIRREVKKLQSKKRSKVASAINKELRAIRREVVTDLMAETGLKRKILNDRLSITRASPKKLEGRITPIYGRRIYMMDYPWAKTIARGGKAVIRLLSPIYRKNLRTGFLAKDGTRMYLRPAARAVESVKGRTVPRLFSELDAKGKFQPTLIQRVMKVVRDVFKK